MMRHLFAKLLMAGSIGFMLSLPVAALPPAPAGPYVPIEDHHSWRSSQQRPAQPVARPVERPVRAPERMHDAQQGQINQWNWGGVRSPQRNINMPPPGYMAQPPVSGYDQQGYRQYHRDAPR